MIIEIKHSQPFINLVFIEQRRRAPFGQRQVMVTHVLLCSGWSLVLVSIPWDRAHPQTTLFGGPSLSNPKTTYGTGPWSMFGRCGKGLCNKLRLDLKCASMGKIKMKNYNFCHQSPVLDSLFKIMQSLRKNCIFEHFDYTIHVTLEYIYSAQNCIEPYSK